MPLHLICHSARLPLSIVELHNTAVVGFLPTILAAIAFFLEPITLSSMRATNLLAQQGEGPFDFKRGLDVEVHAVNCCACIPEVNEDDGARAICFEVSSARRPTVQSTC